MTLDPAAALAIASQIQALHLEKSYRQIAREDFPGVAPGTLNRIANSNGAWLPKDRKILKALGLVGQGRRRTKVEKAITKMARETRKAVIWTNKKKLSPKSG